jgi:hypothetical protein
MPFTKDPGTREDARYCKFLFPERKLCYQGDLKDFQKICFDGMRKQGVGPLTARFYTFMIRFAPRWRERKSS